MKMNELPGTETIEFKLNGETISAFQGETIIQAAKRYGVDIPHLCYKEGYRADGKLPRMRGRDQGRARAGSLVLSPAREGDGGHEQQCPRAALAEDGCLNCC